MSWKGIETDLKFETIVFVIKIKFFYIILGNKTTNYQTGKKYSKELRRAISEVEKDLARANCKSFLKTLLKCIKWTFFSWQK